MTTGPCPLANGTTDDNQQIGLCTNCLTSPLVLKSSSKKQPGTNRIEKTFRLSCSHCGHVVWLPSILKNVTVTDQACTKCSGAQQTFKVKLEFKHGAHPPNINRVITMCVVSSECARILLNLGYRKVQGKIPSSSSSSHGNNTASYGVMTGIGPSQNISTSTLPSSSSSSSRRPSILRPQKKKRARTLTQQNQQNQPGNNNKPVFLCKCGQPAKLLKTKNPDSKNFGREFYKCAKWRNDNPCDAFQWLDEL